MILQPIKINMTGAQILDSIQRGHMVRRSCWQDNILIRVCNEKGIGEDGLIIIDEHTALYTICTNSYFLHLGHSSQPFKKIRTYASYGEGNLVNSRSSEGLGMLFATDWEDYGFISRKDFDKLTLELKDEIRAEERRLVREATGQSPE